MLKSAALLKHQYCVSLFGPTLPAKLSGCPMFNVEVKAKPFSDIPGPKGIYQWPVIGTLVLYKPFTKYTPETLSDLLNAMHDKYGPVLKLRLGPQVVVVSDPEDIENVYQNEGKYPVRHGLDLIHTYNRRNNYTDSLSQLQGPEWHALRVLINKRLLKVDSALHYLEQQNKVADDFVRALQTEKLSPEDIEDLFFRFASESIALVTFNKRLGLFDHNPDKDSLEFLEAMKSCLLMIQRAISGKSLTHKWWRNSTYRTFETNRNILQRISSEHVNEAKTLVEEQINSGTFSEEEPNLLFSLLSEKEISNETVTNLMMSLYTGGTDSTAKNSQVFLLNLAQNPDKQELLRREILDVLGPDGPLTAKTLSKLVYLKAALKESFRMNYPTAIGNLRILPVDIVLGGFKVPTGVPIILFNPRPARTYFENPDQFLPERWLRSEGNTKKDSAKSMIVLPFGHGPRNCIGRRFAVQEIYLAAAKTLQRLHIGLEPDSVTSRFIYTPFVQPEKPVQFKFTRIN
ncbi:cytochrome P450 10 [Biomphalaria pfeifferi]|uniref:Cytochrome P450 10 n=1 Tax=Biomphalaria pfeifferi TaxID=112525 RepID=A0AAD8EVY4_BIOPF|nr:cytochrome P450 10 [Biomphalaria pfeifferi]